MKRLSYHLLTIISILFSIFLVIQVNSLASAVAPDCYISNGGQLFPGACDTIKSIWPSFSQAPGACYAVDGPGPVLTNLRQFDCNTQQILNGDPTKPPIPLGCPGSTLQGPPSPDNLAVCAQIPIGCPGSTQQGPPSAGFDPNTCPYASNGTGTSPTAPSPTGSNPTQTPAGSSPSNPSPTSTSGPGGNSPTSTGDVAPQGPEQKAIDASKNAICNDPNKVDASGKPVCNIERYNSVNCTSPADCVKNNVIVKNLKLFFEFLTGVVGIVVVGAIIFGGIRYSASGGDPQAVGKAKKLIASAVLALVGYIFLLAFLQWLVPGGLF